METYVETEEKHLFYNGGDRISEVLPYSLPNGHDIHCIARWTMEAPEREFFQVPKVFKIEGANISVSFAQTILRTDRYGGKGVVLVNGNWEAPADPEQAEKMPIALSREKAIEKAKRHWDGYVSSVAQQWIDECNQVRTNGGVPRAASGFVVRALKLRGIVDPASSVLMAATESKSNKSEIDLLKEQLDKQSTLIQQLLAKDGGEPAKEKREPATASRSRR